MKQLKARILSNNSISDDFFEISFVWDTPEKPAPGQFLTVRPSCDSVPLLRRPFAFSDYDDVSRAASFIYQKRGRATEIFSGKRKGEILDVIGPLGKPFPVPERTSRVITVAGGIGLGPILFLTSQLIKKGHDPLFVFGCRSANLVPRTDYFLQLNPVICTDDGSGGFKGTVADYLKIADLLTQDSIMYACGPMLMLKACHDQAEKHGITCWISVEQVMACGIGACMGCVVKVKGGYARACKEGPVFDSKDIIWE